MAIAIRTSDKSSRSPTDWIPHPAAFFPALDWLRNYNRKRDFSTDLIAGFIVSVMVVPQSMAVALLAGMPPITGLYASTIPTLLYALFGSSRQLSVGPMSIVALLTFTGVSRLASPGTSQYMELVFLLALMVGLIQLGLGLIRSGFAVKFFSHAVISGFTSASAIIIAFSQLDNLLGLSLDTNAPVYRIFLEAAREIDQVQFETAVIGVTSVLVFFAYRTLVPKLPGHILLIVAKFPAPLLLVSCSILVVWLLRLDHNGVSIVGDIPRGVPSPNIPRIARDDIVSLLPVALVISFIGFIESVSIAKTIATREKQRLNSNQELNALGLANIGASFFSSFPVTGSLSRTAVNYQSGARTQLAGVFTAIFIMLTLLLLTPLFYYLPSAVLAAIIIVSVSGLVNFRDMRRYITIRRLDGTTLLVTFVATLAFGVEYGILIGFVFSLLVFIWRSSDPHPVEIGYLESQGTFRDIMRFPEGRTYDETLIVRIDAPLYFANMEALEQRLEQAVQEKPTLRWVVLDFTAVADIDAVAVDMFERMIHSYRAAGTRLIFAGIKGHVLDIVARAGWDKQFGEDLRYPSVQLALESLGLLNRYTTTGPIQRIGLFGTRPLEEVVPGELEEEDEE